MENRHAIVDTQIGEVTLVAADSGLVGLYFSRHWYKPAVETFGDQVDPETDPVFSVAARELGEYLAGTRTSFDIPIHIHGDPFEERVWALVNKIPYGQTVTYGELAEQLGDKSLAQDVGQAVGHNPLCVIVPCHRVVGKDGKLTGYAGGLERKRFLLDLEEPDESKVGKLF